MNRERKRNTEIQNRNIESKEAVREHSTPNPLPYKPLEIKAIIKRDFPTPLLLT